MNTLIKSTVATVAATASTSAFAAVTPTGDGGLIVFLVLIVGLYIWLTVRWFKGTVTMAKEHGVVTVILYWLFLSPVQSIHAIFIGGRAVRVPGVPACAAPVVQNITINVEKD